MRLNLADGWYQLPGDSRGDGKRGFGTADRGGNSTQSAWYYFAYVKDGEVCGMDGHLDSDVVKGSWLPTSGEARHVGECFSIVGEEAIYKMLQQTPNDWENDIELL